MTCSIWPTSASTGTGDAESVVNIRTSSPMRRRSIFSKLATTRLRSTISSLAGCPRLKIEKLAGESRRLLAGLTNLFDERTAGTVIRHVPEGEVGITVDDGEQIIEIVRHPAGQAADGFHALRLKALALRFEKGGLSLQAFGSVTKDEDGAERSAGVDFHGSEGIVDRDAIACLRDQARVVDVGHGADGWH